MERREMLKGLAAFGVLALLPGITVLGNPIKPTLHFVGLGSAGTNAMLYIHKKGVEAKYSCITGPHNSQDMKHVFYKAPVDYMVNGINYKKRIDLSPEMKALFSDNDHYIVLTGLGATTGTGLISNVLEFLQTQQKSYLAICSLPFKQEGSSRKEYANQKKAELSSLSNVTFFDHRGIVTNYNRLSLGDAFGEGNEKFYTIFKNHFPQVAE